MVHLEGSAVFEIGVARTQGGGQPWVKVILIEAKGKMTSLLLRKHRTMSELFSTLS